MNTTLFSFSLFFFFKLKNLVAGPLNCYSRLLGFFHFHFFFFWSRSLSSDGFKDKDSHVTKKKTVTSQTPWWSPEKTQSTLVVALQTLMLNMTCCAYERACACVRARAHLCTGIWNLIQHSIFWCAHRNVFKGKRVFKTIWIWFPWTNTIIQTEFIFQLSLKFIHTTEAWYCIKSKLTLHFNDESSSALK